MPTWRGEMMNTVYDVIIVGTGAAGLFCALNFPETKKVCIITKRRADESDSFLAQGGIWWEPWGIVEEDSEAYGWYLPDSYRETDKESLKVETVYRKL